MNNNPDFMDSLTKNSDGKIDKQTIKNAIKSGDSSQILNKLSDEDKNKINKILNDKNAMESILKNPLARELMKRFGGEKNG